MIASFFYPLRKWIVPLGLLALFSCELEEDRVYVDDPILIQTQKAIRFDRLAIGQESRYLLFRGERYAQADSHNDYTYLPDTTVIRVTDFDGESFIFREWLTPGSASRNGAKYLSDPDSTFEYFVRIEDDSLRIFFFEGYPTSRVYRWFSVKGLPLEIDQTREIPIEGWKTMLPYCECVQSGFTRNFNPFNRNYSHLNVIIDNYWMQVDGPGSTLVFKRELGLVRAVNYSWWTGQGTGWDLLPPPMPESEWNRKQ